MFFFFAKIHQNVTKNALKRAGECGITDREGKILKEEQGKWQKRKLTKEDQQLKLLQEFVQEL